MKPAINSAKGASAYVAERPGMLYLHGVLKHASLLLTSKTHQKCVCPNNVATPTTTLRAATTIVVTCVCSFTHMC